MAQVQLPEFPDHEFVLWNKRQTLFIEGHVLSFNKTHKKNDGLHIHYFYCNKRADLGCKKSARAIREDNGDFTLLGYNGRHATECIPNPAYLAVRKVRTAIKVKILADPTERPTLLYQTEVNRVRDELGEF